MSLPPKKKRKRYDTTGKQGKSSSPYDTTPPEQQKFDSRPKQIIEISSKLQWKIKKIHNHKLEEELCKIINLEVKKTKPSPVFDKTIERVKKACPSKIDIISYILSKSAQYCIFAIGIHGIDVKAVSKLVKGIIKKDGKKVMAGLVETTTGIHHLAFLMKQIEAELD